MRTAVLLIPILAASLVLGSCGGGSAPPPPPVSVTIMPASATVSPGTTRQFIATVTGTTNTAVTWQVNGTTGGNTTIGTINTNGLYTAPGTIPNPPTATVTAESAAFAADTAVTVAVGGLGIVPGAVYKPFVLIVPMVVLPPVVPLTCQVTAVFVVPVTVAMNCLVVPGLTVAEAGMIVTETGGGGGALPPPQEPRTREAARMGINNTAVRMRSPGRAGTTHVSTGNVLLSKDFTRVSSSAYARNASKAAGLVPE